MTEGCEATPLPEPAFGNSTAPVPEGILQLLRALPRLAWLLLPCLQHPLLLLPSFLALCPTAAPAASASSQCSSFVHLVFVQRCSWKCLWQLWPVGTGTFLVDPSLLCSPGSASVPGFSSTRGCSLPARSHPLPRGHLRNKATSLSTSVTAGEREHCCHSLCCLTSFSQIRSGRRKEMVNSAREFVCCHGRYKPGKEDHSLTVATFAFSGFQSRI